MDNQKWFTKIIESSISFFPEVSDLTLDRIKQMLNGEISAKQLSSRELKILANSLIDIIDNTSSERKI